MGRGRPGTLVPASPRPAPIYFTKALIANSRWRRRQVRRERWPGARKRFGSGGPGQWRRRTERHHVDTPPRIESRWRPTLPPAAVGQPQRTGDARAGRVRGAGNLCELKRRVYETPQWRQLKPALA